MARKQPKTSRRLPAKKELIAALRLARGFIKGQMIEHAVINWPRKPEVGLGQHLDSVLKRVAS